IESRRDERSRPAVTTVGDGTKAQTDLCQAQQHIVRVLTPPSFAKLGPLFRLLPPLRGFGLYHSLAPTVETVYLFTVVGTARGQRAAPSSPRSAALQHGQASASREVFRPLHAGGDAAARRPRGVPTYQLCSDGKQIPHRMGEGEPSSVGRRIQPLWKMREPGLAVPSPVGRARA